MAYKLLFFPLTLILLSGCGQYIQTPSITGSVSLQEQAASLDAQLDTQEETLNNSVSLNLSEQSINNSRNKPNIAVPLYSFPFNYDGTYAKEWQKLMTTQQETGLVKIAVVNNYNGPTYESEPSPYYKTAVNKLKEYGIPLYGYVMSYLGERSLKEAKVDVDNWIKYYGVTNFFIDYVDHTCADSRHTSFYKSLAKYIRAKHVDAKIILNPGYIDNNSDCLMKYGDVIVSFENDVIFKSFLTMPKWTRHYNPDRFWQIIHSVTSKEQQNEIINKSASSGAGYVYVTNDVLDNPYDNLSEYWDDYVSKLQSFRSTVIP